MLKLFRILLFGIVRVIRPLGPLDGLLGGRFSVAFFSVLCLMVAKGVFIGSIVFGPSRAISTVTIQIGLQFIPQIMLAFFTTIGFSWTSMKLILHHPETLVLPSGTNLKKYWTKNIEE